MFVLLFSLYDVLHEIRIKGRAESNRSIEHAHQSTWALLSPIRSISPDLGRILVVYHTSLARGAWHKFTMLNRCRRVESQQMK